MRELRDELEVQGHVVMHKVMTRQDWIDKAQAAMTRAEGYGAKTIKEMRESDKQILRDSFTALGQKVDF